MGNAGYAEVIQGIPTEVLASAHAQIGSATIATRARDTSNSMATVFRKGTLLGKITASGKYMQFDHRSLSTVEKLATATMVTVASVVGFIVGDTVRIANSTNAEQKVITAIDTTAKTLTIGTTTNAYAIGSTVLLINGSNLSENVVVLNDQVEGIDTGDIIVAVVNHGVLTESKCYRTENLDKSKCQRLIWV